MPEEATKWYFEYKDGHGLAPAYLRQPDGTEVENPAAGTPEPITCLNVPVVQPVMVGDEVAGIASTIQLTAGHPLGGPIEGTRIVETANADLANALRETGLFNEIEKPTRKQLDAARKTTNDAANGGEEG